MATAVQTNSEAQSPNPRTRLVLASLAGAVFVIAGIAVAVYIIPQLWKQYVFPSGSQTNTFVDVALRLVVQLTVAGVVIWAGTRLAGSNPPKGLRGGIFLVISTLITIYFLVRAVGHNLVDLNIGMPVTLAIGVALLVLGYRFLVSDRAEGWMHALEEQGWFSTFHYKRTQGVKARRWTLIGILIIGWTGVWAVRPENATFGHGDWVLDVPFTGIKFAILSDIEYTIPVLLAVLTFWVGWRAVNMPSFADFLIATEAEMNKVSWSSRKRLFQDTVVVLVTCALLTVFLLLVDLFWGWLLSRKYIEILPPPTQNTGQVDPVQGKKSEW